MRFSIFLEVFNLKLFFPPVNKHKDLHKRHLFSVVMNVVDSKSYEERL